MREIAHEPRQYVHYLVYYVMAKLLLGEVTAYVLYCFAFDKITGVKIVFNTYFDDW